ncbi:CPBP family intramembrane metalloprotease [Romboutsia sedimentorum]|uniref:CPBP family intramembrane glutamic endopeptidase n=1 Tax=Romboutsia sedimentorum TaxID=1368474 RepID=UPI0024DE3AC3|nr:CPBP family intramembrane glutamic endopeptidase [Romboutsia sedimentorum]MDK2584463.1 CPBP family intramembrane metalloprotease [Romboutsia sedimentorum]
MEKYFDKVSLFKIIIIFVVVAIITAMTSEVEILKNKSFLDENFWMTVANSTVLIYFIWIFKVKKDDYMDNFNSFKSKVKYKEVLTLSILDLVMVFSICAIAVSIIYKINPKMLDSILSEPVTNPSIISSIFLCTFTVILAPIIEEIVFRGILLRRISFKFGVRKGVILSSIVFAVLHPGLGHIFSFISGVVFSLIYLKYKNILINIITHMCHNFVYLLITVFSAPFTNKNVDISNIESNIYIFIGVLGLVFSFRYLFKYIKENFPKKDSEKNILKSYS